MVTLPLSATDGRKEPLHILVIVLVSLKWDGALHDTVIVTVLISCK